MLLMLILIIVSAIGAAVVPSQGLQIACAVLSVVIAGMLTMELHKMLKHGGPWRLHLVQWRKHRRASV